MQPDVALAGFLLTAEEWQSFDPAVRAQLIAAASRTDEAWVAVPLAGMTSESAGDDRARSSERGAGAPRHPGARKSQRDEAPRT